MSRSNRGTVIKVARGRDINANPAKDDKQKEKEEQPFSFMEKTMEDELERRRKDWENEVEQMQGEFFHLNTGPAIEGVRSASKDKDQDKKKTNITKNVAVVHESKPAKAVTAPKRTPGGVEIVRENDQPVRKSPGGVDIFDISSSKNLYSEMPDDSSMFKLRFDVSGFEPEEISVRAEGDKLNVSAQHEETGGKGGKSTRQFNRQVDIPYNVDPDKIVSHLSDEGILSVEAPTEANMRKPAVFLEERHRVEADEYDEPPFNPPGYHSVVSYGSPSGFHSAVRETPVYSRTVHESPVEYTRVVRESGPVSYGGRRVISRTHAAPTGIPTVGSRHQPILYQGRPMGTTTYHSSPGHSYHSVVQSISPGSHTSIMRTSPRMHHRVFNYNHPEIEDTEFGRKLKLVIDLGGKYDPNEISLKFVGDKIQLQAKHEEKMGSRSSSCEFSREFDVPESVEMRTVRAVMADDGRIHIGGSVKENDNHDMVLESVLVDMPSGGRPVTIKRE